MKKLFIVLAFTVVGLSAAGQQIFVEDFDASVPYSVWDPYRGVNGAFPVITAGGLTYSGYPSFSGANDRAIKLGSTPGTNDTGGIVHAATYKFGNTVYSSFLVSITSASTSDNLVFNLIGTPDVTLKDYGLVLKDNGSGSLKFGLKVNGTSTYAAANYVYGTTYLVVVKYNPSTKVYSLLVNPSLAGEPGATLNAAAHTGSAPTSLSQIQINQYVGVAGIIDGIRVFRTWSDMSISSSASSLLLSESFETSSSDLATLDWNGNPCCGAITAGTPGLSGTLVGTGRAAYANNALTGAYSKSFPTVSSGMIYASFLFDQDFSAANTTASDFNFYTSSNTQWSKRQGFVLDNQAFSIKNGDLATNVVNGTNLSTVTFLVLGYNTTTGQYSLWVNPPLGTSTPPTASLTATSSVITAVEGVVMINEGNDDPIFDEIRVSTTWADVVTSTFPGATQPKYLSLTYNGTSINGFVNTGSGTSSYLVVRGAAGQAPIFTPIDGNTYNAGTQGVDRIIQAGTGIAFNDNNVVDGETYFYTVYAYADASKNYNTQAPIQNIVSTEPTSSVSITNSVVGESTIDFTTGTISSSVDGIVVLRASQTTPQAFPAGQPYYTGATNGPTTVVYIGSSTTFSDTGLTPDTNYSYVVLTYIGTSTYINTINSASTVSLTTNKAEPTAQPVSLTFPSHGTNNITFEFISGDGQEDGFIILYRAGSSPTTAPVDGTKYNDGNSLGTATVAHVGTSTNWSLNSLTPNTEYFFDIYAYTKSSDVNAYNYRQLSPLEGSIFTLANNPSSPSGLNFTATTNTSFTATFSSAGTTNLVLRRAGSPPDLDPTDGILYAIGDVIGSATVISNGATTSFNDTGLSPASLYYYKIFAVAGSSTASNYSAISLQGNRMTAPANPVVNHPQSLTQTTLTASWSAPVSATSYRFDLSTTSTFDVGTFVAGYNDLVVASTSTPVTGLTAATDYYFRARAVSATGTSGSSVFEMFTTAPANPTATAASSITQTSFNLNWNAAPTADKYFIDVSTVNTFSSFVLQDVSVGNVLTYNVGTLTAGTVYYYRVRAGNKGTSLSSNVISVTTIPPDPVASGGSLQTTTSFNANWTASATATGYQLDASSVSNFSSFLPGYNSLVVAGGSTVTQIVTGLTGGSTYFYRVRATSASGVSGPSAALAVVTAPPAPVATAATLVSSNNLTATWATANTATSYRLDVATTNTFTAGTFVAGYNNLNVNNNTTALVTGLATGTIYYYRVRGVSASGASVDSNVITTTTAPPAPVPSAANQFSQFKFNANWAAAPNATGYRLDVATDASFTSMVGVYDNLSTGNVITFTFTGGIPGTTYYYRLRAVGGSGTSVNSTTIIATLSPPNPVADVPNGITQTSFNATWATTPSATSYRLDVATNSAFGAGTYVSGYQDLIVGNVSTFNVNTNLVAGTPYFYRVRAANSSGASLSSNVIGTLTLAPSPVATAAASPTKTSFIANWNSSASATSYLIDVSSDGFATYATGFESKSVTSSPVTVDQLSGGLTYSYRVRAVNASGPSPNSNLIQQITIPNAPVISSASGITTSSFKANWETTTGAASYRLDVSNDNFTTYLPGFHDLIVATTQANVTGLVEGVQYKYKVRAVNTAGTSEYSLEASIVTVPPIPVSIAATEVTTTSFKANWNVTDGATEYQLDVSSDDFATFLTGFNNKPTTANSETLTGLQPNATYKYRVRATSSSGTSASSNVVVVLLYALAPEAIAASIPTQTSFTARWNSLNGISSYQLDVSTDDFATTLADYTSVVVSSNSKAVIGLTPGTTYKYHVRAVNATGASANSNTIEIPTVPATPVAVTASIIGQTGFTANWNATPGAVTYLLDVSVSEEFTTLLAGYNGKAVNTNSAAISGLTSGTFYYYRVRSKNASGESPSSNEIGQITIPANPTIPGGIVSTLNNSFIAEWNPVEGADFYELDVTAFAANFTTFVTGYQSLKVEDNINEITGLTPGTAYKFRVRAVNTAGKSGNSSSKGLQTSGSGDVYGVTVNLSSPTFTGTSVTVSGKVTANVGATTATIKYSGLTDNAGLTKVVDVTAGDYSIPIVEDMLDEIGMQFTVTAEDEVGKKVTSAVQKIYRSFSVATSPVFLQGSFAGNRSSIRIISIPYSLGDNQIESIFSPTLGTYDKKTWRLAHYQDGENIENADKLFKIDRGLGYWFNANGTVSPIKTGPATAPKNDLDTPFTLSLAEGWNQIGNPFPFAIDWSDVLADNTGLGVGSLKIYSGSKQNFDNGNKMDVFTGGFVHAENAVTLTLKVSLKKTADGSRVNRREPDLGQDSWELPISLRQGSSEYDIAGIGMDLNASVDNDEFDEIRLPRLDEYLDITFEHPKSKFKHFTKDVVPTATESSWEFSVQSSGNGEDGTLTWDNTGFGENAAKIFLLDVTSLQMTDMRSTDHYSFVNPGRTDFKIYFNRNGHDINPDLLRAGTPYPNPSSASISMLVATPVGGDVELVAFDILGRQIHTLKKSLPAGIHEMSWDGNDTSGNRVKGLYVLRARANNNWFGQAHRVVME